MRIVGAFSLDADEALEKLPALDEAGEEGADERHEEAEEGGVERLVGERTDRVGVTGMLCGDAAKNRSGGLLYVSSASSLSSP